MSIAALLTITKRWRQPKSPRIKEYRRCGWYTHTHTHTHTHIMEYYSFKDIIKKIKSCHWQKHGWTLRILCKLKKIRGRKTKCM